MLLFHLPFFFCAIYVYKNRIESNYRVENIIDETRASGLASNKLNEKKKQHKKIVFGSTPNGSGTKKNKTQQFNEAFVEG